MITIPELNMFNNSYYDAYKGMYCLVAHEITQLRSLYPEGAINNVDSYKVCILTKVMNASYSFIIVIEQARDYASAATILRSIADNIAAYILIYHEKNEDELLLRHYLFIYDGLNNRLNLRQAIKPDHNSPISKSEGDMIRKSVETANYNDSSAIDFCLTKIRSNKLYKEYEAEIEHIITKMNWRFKSLHEFNKKYSWKSLYPIINGKEASSYFISYLSQFVHGLSSSNLLFNTNNPETFNELIGIGISFLGKINEFAQNDFSIEKEYFMKSFFKTEYGKAHLLFLNPEYLDKYFNINKQ